MIGRHKLWPIAVIAAVLSYAVPAYAQSIFSNIERSPERLTTAMHIPTTTLGHGSY